MKPLLFLIFCLNVLFNLKGQLYFPQGDNWATTDPSSLGWKINKLPELKDFLEKSKTKAFIILKDGKIVIEYYLNGHDASKSWYWASAGKSLTSVMVAFAEAEGKLKLNESSSTYLGKGWSSCTAQQEEKIKVWNHLTMTTGLDEKVSFDCTDKGCLKYLAEPGTRWYYHNAPYTLLDKVIEGATGQNLNLYFRNKLGNQIGMEGIFIKSGYNNIFWSNARNMARFGLFVLAKGEWNGKTILNNPMYIDDMSKTSQNMNKAYGYLWWLNGKESFMLPRSENVFPGSVIPSAPSTMYSALGKNDQKIHIVPDMNLVVIRMGENPEGDNIDVPVIFDRKLWEQLSDIMNLTNATKDNYVFSKKKIIKNTGNELIIDEDIDINNIIISQRNGVQISCIHTNNRVDISNLNKGFYIIRVEDKRKRIFVNRFIKV